MKFSYLWGAIPKTTDNCREVSFDGGRYLIGSKLLYMNYLFIGIMLNHLKCVPNKLYQVTWIKCIKIKNIAAFIYLFT